MSDTEERRTKDPRTINIEIPIGGVMGMFRMMTGCGRPEKAASGCCESSRNSCGVSSAENDDREFEFVIRRKEK